MNRFTPKGVRIQYDGTNSEELLTALAEHLTSVSGNEWVVFEETSDGITLAEMYEGTPTPYQMVPVGGWLVMHSQTGTIEGLSDARFNNKYLTYSDAEMSKSVVLAALQDPEIVEAIRTALASE